MTVQGHAQVSYTSFQELVQLQQILHRIPRSSTIVFYDGKNDFWVGCWESQQTHTIQTSRNRLFWERGRAAVQHPVRDWLRFLYGPLAEVFERIAGREGQYAPLMAREKLRCADPAWRARVFDSLLENWRSARAISASTLRPSCPNSGG